MRAPSQPHEADRLRLTDSICKYLDDCPEAWAPITIQNLIHHTSGIPDYESEWKLGSADYLRS